ncbi:hypothetical protein [Agrobacterium vitis]|uniref:Uncharacterized protein n=1 Tax=Agrobacterium vitis TaxID=373 RepID=A0A7K1RKB0_AGRVI|nr:hypothetical protein [Agrobacterium vitis]MCE6076348.1 hypothetical protein [Agrobacterium vitis]MVA58464.1 hypothetical protein [Agrobacterium vitis]
MRARRDRIRIEVFPPSDTSEPEDVRVRMADEAVMALARLIGRQMAREHFKRTRAKEAKTQSRKLNNRP